MSPEPERPQGWVRSDSGWDSKPGSAPADAPPGPGKPRAKPNQLGMALRAIIGLYTALIGVIVFAFAGFPAYLFLAWAWPGLDVGNAIATAMLRSGAVFVAYLAFGVSMLFWVVVWARVFRLRATPGEYTMSDPRLFFYFTFNLLIVAARLFFLPVLRFSALQIWFYRGLGAKIGGNVLVNTVHVYDVNLLTLGDYAVLGGSSTVMCHAAHASKLVIEPVRIGRGATIGERAIVFPGVDVGDGAVIGAGSVVPRGMKIPPKTVWEGVPIKQVVRESGWK